MLRHYRGYLKNNWNGQVGLPFLILLIGFAFFRNWNISWWYFITTIVLYFGAIIFLSKWQEKYSRVISGLSVSTYHLEWMKPAWLIFLYLLGCHVALLFLAIGLLLSFPNSTHLFGIPISGEIMRFLYFAVSIVGGLAIPFVLLRILEDRKGDHKIVINLSGLVALILIALMFGIAFFYRWSFDWIYWLYFVAAVGLYVGACIRLNPGPYTDRTRLEFVRNQFGWHLAFVFLIVGFALHFNNGISIVGFFIASIAVGLVIPYLLFRDS